MKSQPPESEAQLWQRARDLAGIRLSQLAERYQQDVPDDLRHDKGWSGQLLEMALGTTASTKPVPDFEQLGIELKTIPIRRDGSPLESTFVSVIPLLTVGRTQWESSIVYHKLNKVLWIPILAERDIPIGERTIGYPVLWYRNAEEEAILRNDWQELTDLISLGKLDHITAHLGTALQVRPKAANAKALCWGYDENGDKVLTLPRGFYLRPSFTKQLLQRHLA